MIHDDLRSYLDALAEARQLLRMTDPVHPDPHLGAAANAAARMGDGAPALIFENIVGYPRARVAVNVHGSWANHAIAMGLPPETGVRAQVEEFGRRWDAFPVPPERRSDPPFGAVTLEGAEIDLFRLLPLFRLNDGDGGYYIDKAAVISRDPADPEHFGKQNVGIYRLQVKGPNRLGIQPGSIHDIARHLKHAEERGEDLPVAIAVGNDPITTIVAATPMPYDQSEYALAGALRGAPAPIAKAPLTGLDVPWGAEVLLEGVIEGRKREIEGPFGEFTGHYSGGRKMAVIRIDRVSHRHDPIFEHLYLGMPWTEIDYLMGPATCIPILRELRADYPEVRAVNAMYTHGLLTIVSTAKRNGGFAKAVGLRAMTTPHGLGYCKIVIVVDEDVDPFNLPQVMWALSTKVNGPDDIVHLPNMSILPLDPGSQPTGISHKTLIDATTPVRPDVRGSYDQPVTDVPEAAVWMEILASAGAPPPAPVPAVPDACPRCETRDLQVQAVSTPPGLWKIYQCARCLYAWRDTEPRRRTMRPDFPVNFRWTDADFDNAVELPPVPPLRPIAG